MKKYQIVLSSGDSSNAGSKAPNDVTEIASNLGFKKLIINLNIGPSFITSKLKNQIEYRSKWKKIYESIESNSALLLQVPIYVYQFGRKKFLRKLKDHKHVKMIFMVHDVEELRGAYNDRFQKKQFDEMLNLADVIIAHNDKMVNFFTDKGFSRNKLVKLEIFDYLCNIDIDNKLIEFSKDTIIAGNLDDQKTGYLKKLNKIDTSFNLYGPNFNLSASSNVNYNGVVPATKLPDILDSGFGLIWDGNSVETCNGNFGNYLRYNNPHKLSLYLVSGLPVFIWKDAAESKFVIKNDVGYVIRSLNDIPKILKDLTKEKYDALITNTKQISKKLQKGQYTQQAIEKALKK